jgi:hypothetical protein
VLEDKDIIQVDATVIVGVLILLTLTNITGYAKQASVIAVSTIVIIIPFGLSAVLIVAGNLITSFRNKSMGLGLASMAGGFMYLITILMFFIPSIYPPTSK